MGKYLAFCLGCMFLVLSLCIVSHARAGDDYSRHYSSRHHSATDKGLFQVTLIVHDVDLNVGMNSFDILVLDKDRREVEGAEVTIMPWMPDMGHGVETNAAVSYKGDGVYHVDDLEANMPGHWEFRVWIKTGKAEDTVTFSFPSIPIK